MSKFFLAAPLLIMGITLMSRALAKAQKTARPAQSEQGSKRLSEALGSFNRRDPNDPYWEPCLSYYRGWGPGACGR